MKRQYTKPTIKMSVDTIMEGVFAAGGACDLPNGSIILQVSGFSIDKGTCKNTFFNWASKFGFDDLDDLDDMDIEE